MMVAAWGWNGGTFSQPDLPLSTQVWVTALHYLPCALLIALGALVLSAQSPRWARIEISIVAGLGVAALAIIVPRSEERRVGKECRPLCWQDGNQRTEGV